MPCSTVQCCAVSFTNEGETGHTDGPGEGDELTGEHCGAELEDLVDSLMRLG